jgi:Transposase DDE domain
VDVSTFVVTVFCLIDDWLKDQGPLRRRGPAPKLSDSEVLTIEVVGEFLGIDTDSGLFDHFRRHHAELFPALREVHRTTFSRQAANLWKAKERLWLDLLGSASEDPALRMVDSFPMPACRRGRSHRCRVLAGLCSYGYDEGSRGLFYGLRAHLLVAWPGVVVGACLAPANVHDLRAAEGLLDGAAGHGWVLGDRNYWSPELARSLLRKGMLLLAPYKNPGGEARPWPRWLVQKRRRVETVIGQLVGRYNAKRVWARDGWHLRSRWLRKILSHTVAVLSCCAARKGFRRCVSRGSSPAETRTSG